MKEYDVKITETLEKTVTVEAKSRADAEEQVRTAYYNSEYILDSENFTGVEFGTTEEREIQQEQAETMTVLLVKPYMYPQQVQIGCDLEDLQKAVGGDIEAVYAAFTDLTPAILNEFISRIEVHERDKKRAKQAIQHIGIYFNYIGKFENEVTQLTEPTEQEIRQMREKIEEAQKEKSRAYHRQYSREYRARNLEKRREYDRMKAREYRAKKKAQEAAAAPAQ